MTAGLRGLSIFGRTFLLMFAALAIAVGIGVALLVARPPRHNAPVRLADVALLLSARPLQPPSGYGRGPPHELSESIATQPPAAAGEVDAAASAGLRRQLAALLGERPESVVLWVMRDAIAPAPPGRFHPPAAIELHEGFVAARRLEDGRWHVLRSVVEGFPDAFDRQVIGSASIGLLVLIPLAWMFARALTAPIRRFAQAANRMGADPRAAPLPLNGPPEMDDAARAFNAMQARVVRLLEQRVQIIGAIAHDLRTPLTRLAFRLNDLPEPLNARVTHDIQEMTQLIASAVDFSRDRALSQRRERLDLRALAERVADDQADQGHDVTLLAGPAPTVRGDPVALRRAIVNLADNAVKYGERARLRLTVQDDLCRLEVDDDGPGISAPLQQRVFEPFFRLESSRNRDTGGSGLGLAVVHATVVDHGGEVQLGNRPEGGLRVSILLPLADG